MDVVIIVTGGYRDSNQFRSYLGSIRGNVRLIGVDAGALWLLDHGYSLHIAVGDFDTIGNFGVQKLQQNNINMIQVAPEKDETDTELALSIAMNHSAKKIVIYGGFGSRVDHSLANIQLLWRCLNNNIECQIMDPNNRIHLINQSIVLKKHHEYPFVSLIPFTANVSGVTLHGFKYSLTNATLEWGSTIGISNELIEEQGSIVLQQGVLLVIESNDKNDRK